jgi:hypothetical protein
MARRPRLLLSSLAFAALLPVHAAELGDPRVVSHIGQPLVADIELTMLEDAATSVHVRVASPEVYNGAGIAVPPVLSSLNLSVMRRDGRQFLHVTSLRAVDADHVHLYLELVDKGQRAVRLATLWLTPDPTPAPAPAPVRVAAPAPVAAPSPDAVLLAQVERARTAAPAAEAPPRPARVVKVPRLPHPAPVAKTPAAHPNAHPAACAVPAGEAQACVALGVKNDELRTRLGQVEDRMKKLQVSLAAPAAAPAPAKVDAPKPAPAKPDAPAAKPEEAKPVVPAAAPEQAKPIVPAGPRPIHSIKPLVPHKPKTAAPPPDEGLPWGWIGAVIGVLALGGAGAFVVVRRRKAGGAVAPGLLDKLKARFAARTRAPKEAGTEPTID